MMLGALRQSVLLTVLIVVAVAVVGCGKASQHTRQAGTHLRKGSLSTLADARLAAAGDAVALMATPSVPLAQCRKSRLLRAICPRQIPASRARARGRTEAGCTNGHVPLASSRCHLPSWSYEVFALPGPPGPTQKVMAWDGTRWFTPSYAPLYPPPYLVHVLVVAGAGVHSLALIGLNFAGNRTVRDPTDALLDPSRNAAVSLGWVRWYGQQGELILEPTSEGGETSGHLVFLFTAGRVEYGVSVHAWAPKVRETTLGRTLVMRAPEPGATLPQVVATLKAIVGSTDIA